MAQTTAKAATLRSEDGIGLAVAGALHVAVVAVLLLQPAPTPDIIPEAEGIAVSLASEVSLDSTAPDPVPEAAAAEAPVLGEVPLPEVADPAPADNSPAPPPPPPSPRVASNSSSNAPAPRPTRNPTQPAPRATPNRNSGGSRIGDDFLPGSGTSQTSTDTRIPASQIGASAKASIQSQMIRELRPHWAGKAPSGADAEKLVTVVAFQLNPDGSLKGSPRVVRQSGVTPANEAQKGRHAEIALRAVRLAAPFDLPEEYYNAWKSIRALSFDRNLAR
ncbi:MAG: energy transducer TonB [Pseudomonadota bacterium]